MSAQSQNEQRGAVSGRAGERGRTSGLGGLGWLVVVAVGLLSAAVEAQATLGSVADLSIPARSAVSEVLGREDRTYHAVASEGRAHVENRAHGFTAELSAAGFLVSSGAEAWGLSLKRWGCSTTAHALESASLEVYENRVQIQRGSIREWFVNGPLGLQQGFTLDSPPPGCDPRAPVWLALETIGTLRTVGGSSGLAVTAIRDNGAPVMSYGRLVALAPDGQELDARMVRRDGLLVLEAKPVGAYPIVIDPFVETAKLVSSDGAADDSFGLGVAISGNTIVVGAATAAAYVFVTPPGGWAGVVHETAQLMASDGTAVIGGRGIAIADGTIVVGASGANPGGIQNAGAVYVFEQPPGGWSGTVHEVAKLVASDGAANDFLGEDVAIFADTVAAGANGHDTNGTNLRGAAYIFEKPVTGWSGVQTENAKLVASDGAESDVFGNAVAISGDTVLIGAKWKDFGAVNSQGAAYVFARPAGGWSGLLTESAKLLASDSGVGFGDVFGDKVAISSDTIVIGAPFQAVGPNAAQGAAYVFVEPAAGWSGLRNEDAKLLATDGSGGDLFGRGVAVSGNLVVVGAYIDDVGGDIDRGSLYVFLEPAGGWSGVLNEEAKLLASDGAADDFFGEEIAIAGARIVAGAYRHQVGLNSGQGAAYFFEWQAPGPPTANFSWSPVSPLIGQTVNFFDSSTGFPSDYSWDFDGDTIEDAWTPNPTHVVGSAGSHLVQLEVCNSSGCSSHSDTVTVGHASISIAGPTSGTVFDPLAYSASASGCTPDPDGWRWHTEYATWDGNHAAAVTLSWTLAGDKQIQASNSACGAVFAVYDVTISGIGEPAISPSGEHALFCSPQGICDGGDIDPTKPTIVLVHGLQPQSAAVHRLWSSFHDRWKGGRILHDQLSGDANVLQYVWSGAFQGVLPSKPNYIAAWAHVGEAGRQLVDLLETYLGPGYSKPVQLVGHSLGTAVVANAAVYLRLQLPGVTKAQLTALDRPEHLDALIEGAFDTFTASERAQFQFDECYFETTIGTVWSGDHRLRVDNYYALDFSGVGDVSKGLRTYNHLLNNSRRLNQLFSEGIRNDHSGVHQWYRWTMRPVDESGRTVCDPSPPDLFRDPTGGDLNDTLNPCGQGWSWALGNHLSRIDPLSAFPRPNGGRPGTCLSKPSGASVGPALSLGCGSGSSGSFLCSGSTAVAASERRSSTPHPPSASSVVEITVPEEADHLVFDYEFLSLDGGAGDAYAALLVDDQPLWLVNGSTAGIGQLESSPPLSVRGLTGSQRLVVALFPDGDTTAEIRFENFRFLESIPTSQVDGTLLAQAATELEGVVSQKHEVATTELDSTAADDFEVPAEGAPWYLGQILVEGSYEGSGSASLVNVTIAGDSFGAPGSAVCSFDGLLEGNDFVDSAGNFSISLPEICSLDAGRYWVSVEADMDSTQGSWLWSTRLPSSNSEAQWQNPGGGQGLGCTNWTGLSSCFAFGPSRDLSVALLGPPSCDGHSSLDLRGDLVTTQRDYRACLTITAGDDFVISGPGAIVTFYAGEQIELRDGFAVGSEALLTVAVDDL